MTPEMVAFAAEFEALNLVKADAGKAARCLLEAGYGNFRELMALDEAELREAMDPIGLTKPSLKKINDAWKAKQVFIS